MTPLPVDRLLAPLSAAAPCGDDLSYDPAFVALEGAVQGRAEQQFGDTVIAAVEPDWRDVNAQALALAQRTRDLRIAVLLARSGARQHGLGAYGGALALIAGLLEQHWAGVFPLLEDDAGHDPTMRLNSLGPLASESTGLADLRVAAVAGERAALTVRHIELAFGRSAPRPDESLPTQDGVLQALRAAAADAADLPALLRQPKTDLLRIEAAIAERCGVAQGPDLRALRELLGALAQAAEALQGITAATPEATPVREPSVAAAQTASPGAQFGSRSDVLRTLERACDWIEQHEPSNPAPLLIRRAQRLMNKNFLEIVRDLVPDGVDQVEKIAGHPG